jgi:hypothetical protein
MNKDRSKHDSKIVKRQDADKDTCIKLDYYAVVQLKILETVIIIT